MSVLIQKTCRLPLEFIKEDKNNELIKEDKNNGRRQ